MTPADGIGGYLACGDDCLGCSWCRPSSDETQAAPNPHHEHGVYYGNDSWDAECCICGDNPCGSVDVQRMLQHRRWDGQRADRYVAYVIEHKGVLPDAPF